MWLFGCKTISWLTSFAWSWWLDIGRVFITCFTEVKNVKTTTPEDFNLLTVPINSVQGHLFHTNQIPRGLTWFVSIFGLTSIISTLSILECQNYQSLSGADRKITYGNQNTVRGRGIHGWYRFEGAAGTRTPTSCPPKHQCEHSPIRLAKWCSSFSGWWSGHQDSLLPLGVKLLQLVKFRQSDKLRRLLCLLHNWHTCMFPPLLQHRLNRCWFRKLSIAWVVLWKTLTVIHVSFTLAKQIVSVLWLVTTNNNNNNNNKNK